MKIVVITEHYPKENFVGDMFVHVRCKHYLKNSGVDLTVVGVSAKDSYQYEGVNVITLKTFLEKCKTEKFDVLVIHSPLYSVLKCFIKDCEESFKKIIFVFHGYEALRVDKVYPKPFPYMKPPLLKRLRRILSEYKKLYGLRKLCRILEDKLHYVFVSNWMQQAFAKWTKIKVAREKSCVIYNCIGEEFLTHSFKEKMEKNYDFLSIRSSFDGSKFCVDIVTELAEKYPNYKFCLIGKGNYFDYNKKPENLDVVNASLTHKEVIDYCNNAKCALMPTRQDTFGVMTCEMATFGMPTITSDIAVTKEVFNNFQNVIFVENVVSRIDLEEVYNKAINIPIPPKNKTYSMENTSFKELELFKEIVK